MSGRTNAQLPLPCPPVNSVDDFCVFAPPEPGPESVIGNTERIEVAWCVQPGYGTRVMPPGTITGAHFVQTPDYVQVTGVGDLTLINIPKGDAGGELDPHGADGNGQSLPSPSLLLPFPSSPPPLLPFPFSILPFSILPPCSS